MYIYWFKNTHPMENMGAWEQDLYNSERGNYRHEFWIFMDELGFQFWTHGMVKDRPAPGSQNPPYIWHMAALSRLSHLILFSHFANHSRKVVAQELLLIPIFVLKWYSATTCILYDILIICNWLYVFLTFFFYNLYDLMIKFLRYYSFCNLKDKQKDIQNNINMLLV